MNSLTSIQKANESNYMELLRKFDPELYIIKVALIESDLNPVIIPQIIRSIGNLIIGSGYGKVQILMKARVVTQVKGEESVDINEPAFI